jgi:hypothetical protein
MHGAGGTVRKNADACSHIKLGGWRSSPFADPTVRTSPTIRANLTVTGRPSLKLQELTRAIVLAGHLLNSLVRNSGIRRERLFLRYQQKHQQNGRLPRTFSCIFSASQKSC